MADDERKDEGQEETQEAPEAPDAPEAPEAPEAKARPEEPKEEEEKPREPKERKERKKKKEKKKEEEVVPGAHLEPDLVLEEDLARAAEEKEEEDAESAFARYAVPEDEEPAPPEDGEEPAAAGEAEGEEEGERPAPRTAVELAADARYTATGKRKTSVARVILKPGKGSFEINGRPLDIYFPRVRLQNEVRSPLTTAGYHERIDVVAKISGGGVSSQAGALRHGIARALIEADPALRTDLKRRGFLTRDARAKERRKAGLKKARKRPQFSKR